MSRGMEFQAGINTPPEKYQQVLAHPGVQRRLAAEYEAAPEFDKAAVPHFKAMAEETGRQFEFMTGKLGVNVEVTDHDPYRNAGEMVNDVRENNRLQILSTRSTGSHPFFSDDQNHQFRAVHDFFGHAATQRGFDRHGEEAAYQAHSRMYSPMARPALQTETRGQNAYLINRGQFPQQKIATLPSGGLVVPLRSTALLNAVAQARKFNRQQFGDIG